MKKSLFLAILAIFTLNNSQSITIPKRSLMNLAQNCVKQIVCADTTITDQNTIDQLYNISDYMKTYCSTAVGSNKDTLDLKTNLSIDSSILTEILDINNKKIDVINLNQSKLKEIFLVSNYLLIDIFKLLENNIQQIEISSNLKNYIYAQISPNSKFILALEKDRKFFNIIDVNDGKILSKIINNEYVNIKISPDNKFIIASSLINSLDIIDVHSGSIAYHASSNYSSFNISPNGIFITGTISGFLNIINTQNKSVLQIKGSYDNPIISHDSTFIVVKNNYKASLDIIDIQSGNTLQSIPGEYNHKDWKVSKNNKFIVTREGILKPNLIIIDTQNGSILHKIEGDYYLPEISPDSKFVTAKNSSTTSLDIIDIQSGKIDRINGNYKPIQISLSSQFVLARNFTSPGSLDIIDTFNKSISQMINSSNASQAIISPNSKLIIYIKNNNLYIVNLNNNKIISQIPKKYFSFEISPNNQFILAKNAESLDTIYLNVMVPDYKEITKFIINNIKIIPDKEFKYFNLEFATEYKKIMGIEQYNALQKSISDELKRRRQKEQKIRQRQLDNTTQN